MGRGEALTKRSGDCSGSGHELQAADVRISLSEKNRNLESD